MKTLLSAMVTILPSKFIYIFGYFFHVQYMHEDASFLVVSPINKNLIKSINDQDFTFQ